ncbi:MAG: formylglycine-generating enzyme family protein [Geobacter sp.]|nr:formylglycine-generating enzyme family protein [Geobacter sp.]
MSKVLNFLLHLMTGLTLLLSPVAQAAEVKNLQTGQQENRVFAVYDLYGKPGEKSADIKIVIEVGGERYEAEKLAVSGDFGKGVKVGTRKTVYWDVLKDMPSGFEGELYWNIDIVKPLEATAGSTAANQSTGAKENSQEIIEAAASIQLVKVPAGCFNMGSTIGGAEQDEKPVHEVCLDSFYLGKFEITQAQWQTVMGSNPSYFKKCGNKCPVENISWADASRFIKKLAALSGKRYRLPTEAEWEYAARSAGKNQRFAGADDKVAALGWYEVNANGTTHPVGEKTPNDLGIYDMSGNVAEWVQDWKGDYTAAKATNPTGENSGQFKVVRGGSWLDDPASLHTTFRSDMTPKVRTNLIGMRVMLPVD